MHSRTTILLGRILLHYLVPQISFCPAKKDWDFGEDVFDLRDPSLRDRGDRGWAVHGEAEQDEVRVYVGERPEAVVLLVAGGVRQRQVDSKALTRSGD